MARPAAKAALAAFKQGRFWDYHDLIFANQKEIRPDTLRQWAVDLNLDMGQFDQDIGDPAIDKAIEKQQSAMVRLGARGTPGFFISGKHVAGALPFEKLRVEIDTQLAAAQRLTDEGKTSRDAWKEVSRQTHPDGDLFIELVVDGK